MRIMNPLQLAAMVAAGMGASALQAEVMPPETLPRPRGSIGDWITANNKRRIPRDHRPAKKQLQRLQRATWPGSYDEWKRELAEARAAKRAAV
jgi:hypothetical protein